MNFEAYFPNKKEIVHYRFAPGDGFAYRGLEYTYFRSEDYGYLLQRVDNNSVVAFTHEQMTAMFEARLDPMQHFPRRYSPEKPKWYETVTSKVSRADEGIVLVLPGTIKKLAGVIPVILARLRPVSVRLPIYKGVLKMLHLERRLCDVPSDFVEQTMLARQRDAGTIHPTIAEENGNEL